MTEGHHAIDDVHAHERCHPTVQHETVFACSLDWNERRELASCTSAVCCSSHPSILTYCEVESMAKAAVPCYRRRARLPSDGMSSRAHISSAERTTGLTVSDRRGPTIAAKHHVSRVIEDIDVIGKPKDNVVRRTRRVRCVSTCATVWCPAVHDARGEQ